MVILKEIAQNDKECVRKVSKLMETIQRRDVAPLYEIVFLCRTFLKKYGRQKSRRAFFRTAAQFLKN